MKKDQDDLLPPMGRHSTQEELTEQVQRAQQQLMDLQRQQELIEAQKRELEELAERQQEVRSGRKEMVEKLRRALVVLEREEEAVKREVEQISQTKLSFLDTLASVDQITPEEWDTNHLADELMNALSRIDHARAVYNQHKVKLKVLRGEELESISSENEAAGEAGGSAEWAETPNDFGLWFRRGFALSLPLLLLGIVWLIFFLIKK
ncbi:MAG: hypothetical protein K1X66_07390 [Verrucomicrobiae bacterium]|nr:hypothetical protein [Verrucomicrobiae bacterium]